MSLPSLLDSPFRDLRKPASETSAEQLESVMERLSQQQPVAVVEFWQHFSTKMSRVIKAILREVERQDLASDSEYVLDLAFECCWLIMERAPSWKTDDDPPWDWARPLLTARVQDWIKETEGEPELPKLEIPTSETTEGATELATDELDAGGTTGAFDDDWDEYDDGYDGYDPDDPGPDAADYPESVFEMSELEESQSLSEKFDEALGLRKSK